MTDTVALTTAQRAELLRAHFNRHITQLLARQRDELPDEDLIRLACSLSKRKEMPPC